MSRNQLATVGNFDRPDTGAAVAPGSRAPRSRSNSARWATVALTCALLGSAAPMAEAQSTPASLIGGTGSMQTRFGVNAEGYNSTNAYLLAYLVTLMYPDNLTAVFHPYEPVAGDARATARDRAIKNARRTALAREMHADFSQFVARFQEATQHLFSGASASYLGISHCQQGGLEVYDPEAVLVNTSSAVFVLLRGTDRVDCAATDIGYKWHEWVGTDFIFWQETPVAPTWQVTPRSTRPVAGTPVTAGGQGAQVHRGFWQTILAANVPPHSIVDRIRSQSNNGAKKIWIAGHSLGAAKSQVLAALLTAHGLRPQGVYAYAAPHVGNPQMVAWMNQNIGRERIQRFDFINDPVTILPTYQLGPFQFARAGTRNYFDDVQTLNQGARERLAAEDMFTAYYSVPSVFPASLTSAARITVTAKLNATMPSSPLIIPFCYHYPHWLVIATHNRVPQAIRASLPRPGPLGTPGGDGDWSPCNQASINRGMQRSIVDEGIAAAENVIQDVKFTVTQLFANVNGTALADGDYYIRPYRQQNLYLAVSSSCAGQNRCPLVLTTTRTRLTIRKALGAGYHVEQRVGTKTQRMELEGSQLATEGGRVQLFDQVLTPNQTWLFYRAQTNGPFVVKNVAGVVNKVLDSRGCTSANCSPKSYYGNNDRQSQLWLVERAN